MKNTELAPEQVDEPPPSKNDLLSILLSGWSGSGLCFNCLGSSHKRWATRFGSLAGFSVGIRKLDGD